MLARVQRGDNRVEHIQAGTDGRAGEGVVASHRVVGVAELVGVQRRPRGNVPLEMGQGTSLEQHHSVPVTRGVVQLDVSVQRDQAAAGRQVVLHVDVPAQPLVRVSRVVAVEGRPYIAVPLQDLPCPRQVESVVAGRRVDDDVRLAVGAGAEASANPVGRRHAH